MASDKSKSGALRRLQKELKNMNKSDHDSIMAEPKDGNMFVWTATVLGPEETPYENGVFNLELSFPENYPFKAPEVKFLTKVYHPSVKQDTLDICLDVLKDWAPTLNVIWVLEVIRGMLRQYDNVESPLEPDIATMIRENPKKFEKTCRRMVQQYAA